MADPDYLIECSWEVCNKVGGIYTVVSSKAERVLNKFNGNYFLIGPYFADKVQGVFEEQLLDEKEFFCTKKMCDELAKQGIILHFGKWLIEGEPKAILIDSLSVVKNQGYVNWIKSFLWEHFKIDSLRTGWDYDEPVAWAFSVGKLIELFTKNVSPKTVCCQFHEWLTGPALLYLKANNVKVASVFTTHATVLGRSLVGSDFDLYKYLDSVKPDDEAYNKGVEAKHLVEKVSAQNCDIFTTVSEITGIEAEKLLGRKPDVLLPNGLDLDKYLTFEDVSMEHMVHRDQMREFVLYYFFPYYKFDIKDTMFFFLSGRYEFRAKGIDVYIKSLSELNKRLVKDKSKKTVVAFIFVPAGIRGVRPSILENRTNYDDIKDDLDEQTLNIKKNLLYNFIGSKDIVKESLFDKDFLFEMKKKVLKLSKKGNPPLSTHFLIEDNDIIVRTLIDSGLDNSEDDRVKVVFYPIYLSGADGLLDLNYQQVMIASHLGVFPSSYEPWGYTPLECCANGVSNITTDLAGYGRYVKGKVNPDYPGVFVIDRFGKEESEVTEEIADVMYKFTKLSKKDRVENKMAARKIAELADWSKLVENYFNAYSQAVKRQWS